MGRLAISRMAQSRCLKKPIDGFGDSPYIAIARIFSRRVQHARKSRRTVASGAPRLQRDPFALDQWPKIAQGTPAGDRVLIGAPNTSKELSSLQEASYAYQENSLRRPHIGGQTVLAGTPLSPTGAFMDIAKISRDGRITPGGHFVRWPQGPMASKGAHLLFKGQGSHRLISLKESPAGDRVLIGTLNTSKELSFLQEASYVYQENSLRRLHIVGQKIFSWSQGPRRFRDAFRWSKGAFNRFVGPSIE